MDGRNPAPPWTVETLEVMGPTGAGFLSSTVCLIVKSPCSQNVDRKTQQVWDKANILGKL